MDTPLEVFDRQAAVIRRLGGSAAEMAAIWGVSTADVEAFAAQHNRTAAVAFDPNWAAQRRQWIWEQRHYQRDKRRRQMANPAFRVENATRARIYAAIKGRSDGKLFSRLGYSLQNLMDHLEARFQPGMNWGNYGSWHIDHIKPCASFNLADPAQFRMCWALSNLQPLWASDNIRKGAKCPS